MFPTPIFHVQFFCFPPFLFVFFSLVPYLSTVTPHSPPPTVSFFSFLRRIPLSFFRNKELKPGQGAQWWSKLREWVHEPSFSFPELTSKAFNLRTKGGLRPVSWAMLENYHDKNEAEVRQELGMGGNQDMTWEKMRWDEMRSHEMGLGQV